MDRVSLVVICGFNGALRGAVCDAVVQVVGATRRVVVVRLEDTPEPASALASLAGDRPDLVLLEAESDTSPDALVDGLILAGPSADERDAAEGMVEPSLLPPPLHRLYRLDAVATVVDAATFMHGLSAGESLFDHGLSDDPDEDVSLPQLLVAQVEFCNRILVAETHLVTGQELDRVCAVLRWLNPTAALTRADLDELGPEDIVRPGQFDYAATALGTGVARLTLGRPGADEGAHGVHQLTWSTPRPFHPERLWEALHADWEGAFRVQGLFWVVTRPDVAWVWSQFGPAATMEARGRWWAAHDRAEWPQGPRRDEVLAAWHADYGDRRQHFVVGGVDMDVAGLRSRLEAALLTGEELADGWRAWAGRPDPFPTLDQAE